MKKLVLISAALISAVVMSSCSSGRYMSDIDNSVDFEDYKTYTFVSNLDEEGEAPRSLTERRIEKAIKSELEARNYTLISKGSDFLVYYSSDYETSTSYYESSHGSRYGRRWRGGYSYTTVSEVETRYGIINIDIVDATSNNVIWSTSIKRSIPNKNKEEKLNMDIAKAFREFPVQIIENSKKVITD